MHTGTRAEEIFSKEDKLLKLFQTIIRLILLLAGVAGCTGFAIPFVIRRILNAGNFAGMIVCAAIVLYAVLMPRFHQGIRLFWQKTSGRIVLSVLAAGLAMAIVLIIVMTSLMVRAAHTKPSENATVIVLGCKAYGERPSIPLEERLKAAIRYLDDNPEAACVVSGGQGADETMSEAQCMYLYLVDHGIAPGRIYREDRSTSTRENLAFSYEVIKEHGLNEEIAIATNNYHEYRAGKVADSLGLKHGAASGSTALWLLPTYYARELLAILYEWVFF